MLSFKIIGPLVLEKKIFKVFTIYGHGDHLGYVTCTIYINFQSPFPRRLHIKFGIDWPSGFREDVWKKYGHIHANSPHAGADNPLGSNGFINSIIQSI